MTTDEVERFIEYLGAPSDVGWGRKRAKLGHSQPWTDALETIHIEFGNEWFTFKGGGYPGPDYWQELIETAKQSPYYKPNVVFHVNPFHSPELLDYTPNADYSALFPGYILRGLDDEVCLKHYQNEDDLFRFILAYPMQAMANVPRWLQPVRQAVLDHPTIRPSVHETGYHTTHGTARAEYRDAVSTSLPGAPQTTSRRWFATFGAAKIAARRASRLSIGRTPSTRVAGRYVSASTHDDSRNKEMQTNKQGGLGHGCRVNSPIRYSRFLATPATASAHEVRCCSRRTVE